MNEVIRQMGKHSSVREFDISKDVSEQQVQVIIKSAMAAPNWINGQQVSVIAVRNPDRKTLMAKLAGDQKWVEEASVFLVFCMDFYRSKIAAEKNNKKFRIVDDVEALIIGATDVGIALGTAVVAAESMDLGTVPIGGIRKNAEEVIKILELPEYVYPISGLAIGYPKVIPGQKPRLPLQATYHTERYDLSKMTDLIDQYDETMVSYISERTNGQDTSNWSSKVATFYETRFEPYADETSSILKKQGFHYK